VERIALEKINPKEKFALFEERWSPKIVGELNGQYVKLVKFFGPFVWHHHDEEDEMFLVVKGRFRMEFRDRNVWIEESEFIVVPRGVEHRPVAEEEAIAPVIALMARRRARPAKRLSATASATPSKVAMLMEPSS